MKMTYQINYAYACHTGKVRANNEDNFWCCGQLLPAENHGIEGVRTGSVIRDDLPVLSVFDGMGGESYGEMASYLAAEAFDRYYHERKKKLKRNPKKFLEDACRNMNAEICRYGSERKIHSMGTTMAMMAFGQKFIYACNLGDSRIYRIKEGQITQISTDHVLGQGLFGKAPLTQYLGVEEESMALEPSIVKEEYQAEERYLVCSDGLTDMLSDGEIAEMILSESPVEQVTEMLMEKAMEKGGRDNTTVILCEVKRQEEKSTFRNWLEQRKAIGDAK